MLRINLRVGESIRIGDVATLTLEEKSGQMARLAFDADRSIPINRIQSHSPASIAASNGINRKP